MYTKLIARVIGDRFTCVFPPVSASIRIVLQLLPATVIVTDKSSRVSVLLGLYSAFPVGYLDVQPRDVYRKRQTH